MSDIREAVAGCLSQGDKDVLKCSTREKGKYTSITLKVHVENSSQLYKVTHKRYQVLVLYKYQSCLC